MKMLALDSKRGSSSGLKSGIWWKNWQTLGINCIFDCEEEIDILEKKLEIVGENINQQPHLCCIIIIHRGQCEEYVVDIENRSYNRKHAVYIMWVDGGGNDGCQDDPTRPHIHYSKRKVPNSVSLAFLKPDLDHLCRQLEHSNGEPAKVVAAWQEWEQSAISRFLSLISPLAISPANAELAGWIAGSLDSRLCKEVGERAGIDTGELVEVSGLAREDAASRLLGWMRKFPEVPGELARRFL